MASLIDQTTYNSPADVFKNHINGYCPEITSDVHSKSLMEAISDHLSDDVLRAEFAVCMRCTCCKAHQSNRPAAIDSQFNTAKYEIPGETFPRCPCPADTPPDTFGGRTSSVTSTESPPLVTRRWRSSTG